MTDPHVHDLARNEGADLCGVAPVDRFDLVPKGFHPRDLLPECRSVIVIARRFPETMLHSPNRIPYTRFMDLTMHELDRITLALALKLESLGCKTLPIPADDPYEYWDADRSHGRGILSLRHAAWLAGLGALGRNTLLIHRRFGNRINLAALLVDREIEGDEVERGSYCPPSCRLCLDHCPGKALDGHTVDQERCRHHSITYTGKGYTVYNCLRCRQICPAGTEVKVHQGKEIKNG